MPCSANVTVATQYGTASRAVSFTPVCLPRQPQIRDDLTVLVEQMVSYSSYVLDYVAYKSTPVLTAYFAFGSIHIGFQNVGPFPYMAERFSPNGSGLWPPSVYAVTLTPGEYKSIDNIPSGEPWFPTPNGTCRLMGSGPVYDAECSVMYRWMNVYVYWNDTLEIWINNVRVYNGTPPAAAAEFTAPQGFTVAFDPGTGTLAVKYLSIAYTCKPLSGVLCLQLEDPHGAYPPRRQRKRHPVERVGQDDKHASADARRDEQRDVERHARRALRGEGRRLRALRRGSAL